MVLAAAFAAGPMHASDGLPTKLAVDAMEIPRNSIPPIQPVPLAVWQDADVATLAHAG